MFYNYYTLELLAQGMRNDRDAEALKYGQWLKARKALRTLKAGRGKA